MNKSKVTEDLVNDCSVNPILGLRSGVYINWDDIDFSATTFTKSVITALTLKSGASGVAVSWLKRMGNANNAFVASPTEREGFTHAFAAQLGAASSSNVENLNDFVCSNGGIIVAKSNFIGENGEDEYKVFGITTGLHLTETIYASNENQGAITYILSTQEGDKEKWLFNTLLETDNAVTAARYDALFATV